MSSAAWAGPWECIELLEFLRSQISINIFQTLAIDNFDIKSIDPNMLIANINWKSQSRKQKKTFTCVTDNHTETRKSTFL